MFLDIHSFYHYYTDYSLLLCLASFSSEDSLKVQILKQLIQGTPSNYAYRKIYQFSMLFQWFQNNWRCIFFYQKTLLFLPPSLNFTVQFYLLSFPFHLYTEKTVKEICYLNSMCNNYVLNKLLMMLRLMKYGSSNLLMM